MSFKEGEYYSRKEINSVVGGSLQSTLIRVTKIVAVCLKRENNRRAPEIYLNGDRVNMVRDFNVLRKQKTPFHVFVKEPDKSKWQYRGYYEYESHTTDPDQINKHKINTVTEYGIYAVVFLNKVK